MKNHLKILPLLFFGSLFSQEKPSQKVFFEFDKYSLNSQQAQILTDFIKKIDPAKIESIAIYGYCDDRGAENYNYTLSDNRVNTVQNILTLNGIKTNKIIVTEGKGRVPLKKYTGENLNEIRSKNRRVDLFIVKKDNFEDDFYNSLKEYHKVGDRIFLENILFPLGSSKLTQESKKELDRIVVVLQKNKTLQFEIRGHVCCTPNYYTDAIDKDSKERKLSVNRARNVYNYLKSKNILSNRMIYKGCGNKTPLKKGESFDRRVEFYITKI